MIGDVALVIAELLIFVNLTAWFRVAAQLRVREGVQALHTLSLPLTSADASSLGAAAHYHPDLHLPGGRAPSPRAPSSPSTPGRPTPWRARTPVSALIDVATW